MDLLKEHLQQLGLLSNIEIEEFINHGELKTIRKSDYFIRAGEVCNKIGFITSGIIRSFYITESGTENTYCFMFPKNFLGAYSSYINGLPTYENMQAITDVEVVFFSKSLIESVSKDSIGWQRFLRKIAEEQYLELEKRIMRLQSMTAEKRYELLLDENPEYNKYIPLQYISSYLGITQRHLSRLRTKH